MLSRKRKRLIQRQPNGQPSRCRPQIRDDVMGVVRAQRLRLVKEGDVADQKAETPLGVYFLTGRLHGEEGSSEKRVARALARYDAGVQYAAVVNACKRDMDSPSEDAQNRVLSNLMGGGNGGGIAPIHTPEQIREARAKRRKRYDDLHAALRAQGLWVFDAVNTVALRGRAIAPEKLPKLCQGLDALAVPLKLAKAT